MPMTYSAFFRAVRKEGELLPLEADLQSLRYTKYLRALDKNSKPIFRLYNAETKVGVVAFREVLEAKVESLVRGNVKV